MATITTTPSSTTRMTVALDRIRVPGNVRNLDQAHVDALAGSIALQGLIVPVVVRPDGSDYVLVAGFHRVAAHRQLGLDEIRVELCDAETEDTVRGIENIARKDLRADEEAAAVSAMLARGLTVDGAAQALGWPRARVTARMKLLELPAAAREMVGAGTIALSAVELLRAIGAVSAPLLDAVIAFIADGNGWAAERLAREPGWVIDSALRATDAGVFCAHLTRVDTHELPGLRLGKKTDQLVERAIELHKKLDRYAYGAPDFRFADAEVDQARASGACIEFNNVAPLLTDRGVYRELCKQAIARTVSELEEKVAQREEDRQAQRRLAASGGVPDDPVAVARRDEQAQLRELAEQAHGVNLDLGASLLKGVSSVDSASLDVARVYVYSLIGTDWDGSGYTQTGERVVRLAAFGIRLVLGEFRSDVTKTRKDGSRGKLRIGYGDPREPEAAIKWLWRYLDGAKTSSDLLGRGLVVLLAEQYASRLVVPQSQRTPPIRWSSHRDIAAKALKRIAAPHLPASLKQLESAIARAHRELEAAEQTTRKPAGRSDVGREVDDSDIAPDVENSNLDVSTTAAE